MEIVKHNDPLVISFMQAVQTGNVDVLNRLLTRVPGLASMGAEDTKGVVRTPLHVVTDWPGYFPKAP